MKQLKLFSIEGLRGHCPLCGIVCKDYYCTECDFKYDPNKVYFSDVGNPDRWE